MEIAIATPGHCVGHVVAHEREGPDRAGRERGDEVPTVGFTRPATCAFVAARTGTGVNWPSSHLRATTAQAPETTSKNETPRFRVSAVTDERTVPRTGVINGATISAPITVAVESVMTRAVAITAASNARIGSACARARDHRIGVRCASARGR
jgi:hypothetical protein